MEKKELKIPYGTIKYITNKSKSKKLILYLHGLDGSASFSKPLFDYLGEYKIVAIEQRGHQNSDLNSSRFIYKHLRDYKHIIDYFSKQGYSIYVYGESMGAAFAIIYGYKNNNYSNVKAVFSQSIPNKLPNIMLASKWKQFVIQFRTTLCFLTGIDYKYKTTVNYKLLSSNKIIHRVARIADKNKTRKTRESIATWAAIRKAWKIISRKKLYIPFHFFIPGKDIMLNSNIAIKKIEKAKKKKLLNRNYLYLEKAQHILMWEKEFKTVVEYIKKEINK